MTKLMRAMVVLSVAAVAISCGVFVAEKADAKAKAAPATRSWPQGASIALANRHRETVVAFVQPHTASAQASLDQVQQLMKQHPTALAYVMFVRPASADEGWEVDEHWAAAARIPNAIVLPDPGGAEQARFGAAQGEAMVYDTAGQLEAMRMVVAAR